MGPSGKWIDGIDPNGSVEDAARRSLDARLTAVVHWLPLAAYLAEQDVEHVHRLRVATRRAIAALRLYRDWLPPKQFRRLKKQLKKVRRAAGDARDLDVLVERMSREYGDRAAPVVALIAECRKSAQPAIVEMAERCRKDDQFVRRIGKLIAEVRPPAEEGMEPTNFHDWAGQRLNESSAAFFTDMPDDSAAAAALHQFRIRGKALRYTIELVASAFSPELRRDYYPRIEELQERLGKIQDHVTAAARLKGWADDNRLPDHEALLTELAEEEVRKRDDACREFRAWWASEGFKELPSQALSA